MNYFVGSSNILGTAFLFDNSDFIKFWYLDTMKGADWYMRGVLYSET